MGMFDYVVCEYPLPGNPPQWVIDHARTGKFQTKDTDRQWLERYTITADGRLVHHAVRYEEVTESEGPYRDHPDPEARALLRWVGSIRSIPIGEDEVHDIHRDLRFSTCSDDEPRVFYEYVARFTNGQLERITGGLLSD